MVDFAKKHRPPEPQPETVTVPVVIVVVPGDIFDVLTAGKPEGFSCKPIVDPGTDISLDELKRHKKDQEQRRRRPAPGERKKKRRRRDN